jgi:hypothetical protein
MTVSAIVKHLVLFQSCSFVSPKKLSPKIRRAGLIEAESNRELADRFANAR